ncbi:MAG: flagellar hook-basal body complex protein [Alphaproteobacteria bacterium]
MSLYGALFAGVSGLGSQSSAMGAIADNVTNVNTVGYKNTKVNFQTLITKQVSLTKYSAGGVQSKPRQNVDLQGLLQSTSSSTDVGISGKGFMIVNTKADPTGQDMFTYTRAGSFKVDREGYLQNVGGQYMQGWPLLPWDNSAQSVQVQVGNDVFMKAYKTGSGTTAYINDNIVDATHLKPLNLNEMGGTAQQTRNIRLGANLPSGDAIGTEHKTNVLIYDSLGNPANLQYNWTNKKVNGWDLEVTPPLGSTTLELQDSNGYVYSAMGRLDFMTEPATGQSFTIKAGGASGSPVTYTFTYNNASDDFSDTLTGAADQTYNVNPTSWTQDQTIDKTALAVNHALNVAFPSLSSTLGHTPMVAGDAGNLIIADTSGTALFTVAVAAADTVATIATKINTAAIAAGVDVTGSSVGTTTLNMSTTSTTGFQISSSSTAATLTALGLTASTPFAGKVYAERLASTDSLVLRQDSTLNAMQINLPPSTAIGAYSLTSTIATNPLAAGAGNLVISDPAGTLTTIAIAGTETLSQIVTAINSAMGGTVTSSSTGTTGLILASQYGGYTIDATSTAATLTELGLTSGAALGKTTDAFKQQSVAQPFSVSAVNSSLTPATTQAINFNGDGTPASINVASVSVAWANGASDQTGSDKIGQFLGNLNVSDGMTQFAGSYQIAYINQNGAQFGNFSGVSIGSNGIVTALFDNGVTRPVYQIPVATFVNPNAMDSLTGNSWISTDGSGLPTLRTPGDAGAGQLNAASLESSTVDLGEEFTAMITTQRAYSASAKIITTADQMLDELVQIKR